MADSAARAMLIVDYGGLNGVFAVSSSPTPRKKSPGIPGPSVKKKGSVFVFFKVG